MPVSLAVSVRFQFAINVLLQLLDGFLTYRNLATGIPEANPLVRSAITEWGALWGLIYWKALACALLLLIFTLRHKRRALVIKGLTLTAAVYVYVSLAGLFLLFFQTVK